MTKNRHGLPKKRPTRSAKDDIDDDLPELEPLEAGPEVEELPTLELVEDEAAAPPAQTGGDQAEEGPVKIVCSDGGPEVDTTMTVTVPAMDKKAMADAVGAALRRLAETAEERVRYRRVLVTFPGDVIIGTATKTAVVDALRPKKPLRLVLHRGFGNEVAFEGTLPQVAFAARDEGDSVRVVVATGDLEARDLPIALAPHLERLVDAARDRRFTFTFTGAVKPDAAICAQIQKALCDAEAARIAVGDRVLFDRELTDRVTVVVTADHVDVQITPADDERRTVEAITTVLPGHAASFAGKTVRLAFTTEPRSAEREAPVDICREGGARRIELRGAGEPEVIWPKLIAVAGGRETTLRVQPNGRSRAAVMSAFARECQALRAAIHGMAVVVDWPAGFDLDAEVERVCVRGTLGPLSPRTLACTIGGELREPFLPIPVEVTVDGPRVGVTIHSEAGKPPELQRAVDRRLRELAGELRGKAVRVTVAGHGALSRATLRSACDIAAAAGATRFEIDDHGTIDVVLPPMLTIEQAAGEVRIAAAPAGRDAAQQQRSVQRELEAVGALQGASVLVAASPAADTLVAAVIARGAVRVVLDGAEPVQVHPPLFAPLAKQAHGVRIEVQPGDDETITGRQLARELPPLLAGLSAPPMVTVEWPGIEPSFAPFRRLVDGLLGRNTARILLDDGSGDPVQVHPPVAAPAPAMPAPAPAAAAAEPAHEALPAPESEAEPAIAAAPSEPAPVDDVAPCITLLARKDDATPPMVVLGVEAGTDAQHIARVEAAMERNLPRLRGRCVLLVLRQNGLELPIRREDALVRALRTRVATAAAATLLFRGPDAQQRPHFQVAHSRSSAMPFGATFADPRR